MKFAFHTEIKLKEKYMYAINKNGEKMPVDDSAVDYSKGYHEYVQTITLVSDNIYLKPVWILQLQKDEHAFESYREMELEMIKEIKFDHNPTDKEIIHSMASHGLGIGQIVTIIKGYEMAVHYDD